MKEIAPNIIIETEHEGVTLGAIRTDAGVVMVDAPLNPKDTMTWRATCSRSTGVSDRLLVLLDEHPDRITGASGIKCPIITSERTAQALSMRSPSARSANPPESLEWDDFHEPVNMRGFQPEITFTSSMAINWGDEPILLEHHPGPSRGNTWVILPEKQIAFLGDTVITGEPPFFGSADVESWLQELHDLQLARFKDFVLISGRADLINRTDVKNQEKFLKKANRKIKKLLSNGPDPKEIEKISSSLAGEFKTKTKKEAEQFKNRLVTGITQYAASHTGKKTK